MKLFRISWPILLAALVSAERLIAPIFIQPVTTAETAPSLLAEVGYDINPDTAAVAESQVLVYEAPELPEGSRLVRIGTYDRAAARWTSSISVASVENFSKGYSPHFLLSVNSDGAILGVALRGVLIDAGQTRDFGPQARVDVVPLGKQPELNRPVLLSPEGRKVEPEEKTFLQKYWWMLAIGALLLVSGGGGGDQK